MKATFTDFASRTSESARIIQAAPKAIGDALNNLQNFFYAISAPLENAEYQPGVDTTSIDASIRQLANDCSNGLSIDRSLRAADLTPFKSDILANGLKGIFKVTAERLKDGRLSGNGHHARQEAAANAIISVNSALQLNI